MSKLQADLLLLVAAALWGFGNVPQKTVLEHLDPLSAVGLRCLIGGVLVLPMLAKEARSPVAAGFQASLVRVVLLFAVAITLQQTGYAGTSVTNASFLIGTATVMTPAAAWLLTGERLTASVGLAACLSLVGALLLAGGLAAFSHGDAAIIVAAASYSLWTVELGRHAQTHGRPFTTMAAQFLGAATLALPFGLSLGGLSATTAIEAWPQLVALGLFSTALPFGIQTVAQRFTPASHAAVIVSTESVFGALGAALLLGERITPAGALGGLVMLCAVIFLVVSNRAGAGPAKPATAAMEELS